MHVRSESGQRASTDRLAQIIDTGWPVALLVVVFVLIDHEVRAIADLGPEGYRRPVLLVELVKQHPVLGIGGGLGVILSLGRWHSFGPEWPSFERGWSLRVPIGVIVAILTWTYACYDYNLWADRLHVVDRFALIALAALTLWRPVFLASWTIVVSMIAFQFRYPIGVDQLAETFQLVRITELFVAVLLVRLLARRWYAAEFVFIAAALVAGAYWVSGLGKLRLGWFAVGPHFDSLFFATHGNGWLGFMSPDTASSWGRAMAPFLWPLLIVGTVVEFGAVALLWGRRPLRLWLAAFVCFHFGVFALSGILFWKWMVFEVALLAFLGRDRLIDELPIFDLPHAVIGTALIVAAPFWSRPVDLSWLDSPVNYVYRFDATMSDGSHRRLPPAFFRPHDYLFTLSPFGYLSQEPELPVVWGALRDRNQLDVLYAADGTEAIKAAEARFGTVDYDPERAAAFDAFVSDFVSNWNRRQSRSSGLSIIGPPPQLWTSGEGPTEGTIDRVTVWKVTTYWNGEEYDEINTTDVREIEITSTNDPSS